MKQYKGSCLCGAIQFSIVAEPKDPHICYCQMCQKWSGAPAVAWVSFPLSALSYEKGRASLYRSSEKTQRGFCNKCGSTLFALDDNSKSICMTILVLTDKDEIIPVFESFKESELNFSVILC